MMLDMDKPQQAADGLLIQAGINGTPGMTIRGLAAQVNLSEARIRQYINGYASAGRGQFVTVDVPAERMASIAFVLDLSVQQLRDAGRGDAATLLEQRLEREKQRATNSVGADDEDGLSQWLTRTESEMTDEEVEELWRQAEPVLEALKAATLSRRKRGSTLGES